MTLEKPFKTFDETERRPAIKKEDDMERYEAIRAAVDKELDNEMLRLHKEEPFHNEGHPDNVLADAENVLDVFERHDVKITEEDRLATKTGAKGHDIIIHYSIETNPEAFNFGQRVRHRGFDDKMPPNVKSRPEVAEIAGRKVGNEELSWIHIKEVVRKHDPDGKVYTPAVMEKTRGAVGATYPDAGPYVVPEDYHSIRDPKTEKIIDLTSYLGKDKDGNPTVFLFDQPLLKPDSEVSTISVAWGDLLYGGRHSSERFRMHGNEEYREINEIISATVKRKMSEALGKVRDELPASTIAEIEGGTENLSPERKAEIAKSALGWIFSQVGFLLGQKMRFESGLQNMQVIKESADPDNLRRELRDVQYKNFDQNIIDSVRRVDKTRETFGGLANPKTFSSPDADARFKELLQEMGYEVE